MALEANQLLGFSLFESLTDEQRRDVASKMEERHVGVGQELSHEGGGGYFFFVIADGTADVARDGVVVAQLGPDDFFGELAILETPRRTATVTATSPMTLLAMFGADFAKLAADRAEVAARVEAAISSRRPG